MKRPGDITESLQQWSEGDRRAFDACLPVLYEELSQIAAGYLRRERRNHTLQTSALVNEAYLKLIDQERVHWRNRAHFFAISSQIMRRLLVDHARERGALKRGGNQVVLSLEEALVVGHHSEPAVLAIDAALQDLAAVDPELSEVTEMRFFGGLENEEIAVVLGISSRTVIRRWRSARAWLLRYFDRDK